MTFLKHDNSNINGYVPPAPKWGQEREIYRVSDNLFILWLSNTGMKEGDLLLIVYKTIAYLTNLAKCQEMLDILPLNELLQLYKRLEEDIFLFKKFDNDRIMKNKKLAFGLVVEQLIQKKLPQETEPEEIIKVTANTKEPLTSRKTAGLVHGWYYPYELDDITLDY